MEPLLITTPSLSESELLAVLALAEDRSKVLHREALSDSARRILTMRSPAEHILVMNNGSLSGYGVVSSGPTGRTLEVLGDDVDSGILELVLGEMRTPEPLYVWLHGLTSQPHQTVAQDLHLVRSLNRLRRDLPASPPEALPPDVRIAAFRPDVDDQAWLELNARSFSSHPDQGLLRQEDLTERKSQPWFDPEEFLLAWHGDELVGFCWVKEHHDPWGSAGEIYVIGVDPKASGLGLGRSLLRHGLSEMYRRNLKEAFLYVESDNERAKGLYEAEGFEVSWYDACWASTN